MRVSFFSRFQPLAITVAAVAVLAACAAQPLSTADLPKPEVVAYRCADQAEIAVTYAGRATGMQGTADLAWDGRSFLLKRDASGGDARYTDGTLTLNTKGDEAFVEKAGEIVLKDCNAKVLGAP